MNLTEILGGLIIVAGLVLIVYIVARYTYLIKKMLAEKGIESSGSNKIKKMDVIGLMAGVAIGLLISSYFSTWRLDEDTMDLLSWGVILLSGALGLAITNKIQRKVDK